MKKWNKLKKFKKNFKLLRKIKKWEKEFILATDIYKSKSKETKEVRLNKFQRKNSKR